MAQKLETTISAKDRSKAAFRSFGSGLKKASGAIFNFKTAMVAAAGIAGLGLMIKKSLDAVDANKKLADRLGLSTQQLAGYEYAAVLAGESIDTVRSAFGKMEKNLYEAERGLGTAIYALDKLNVSAKTLNQLSTDQRIKAVADAIGGLGTQQEKIGVAMQLFGRAGVNLVNMLDTMSEGLTEAQEKAIKLGYALSGAASANIEKFNDSFARLKLTFVGISNVITAELAPAMQTVTDKLTAWMEKFVEGDGMQGFFDFFYSALEKTIDLFADFGVGFLEMIRSILIGMNKFKKVFDDEFIDSLNIMIFKLRLTQAEANIAIQNYAKLREEQRKAEEVVGSTNTRTQVVKKWQDNFAALGKFSLKAAQDISVAFDSAAVVISTGFGKAFEDIIMGTKKASAAFKDLGRTIYAQLVKMFVMRMFVAPFTNMFGNFMTSVGIPQMAQGGKVSAGKPYIVGDGGVPELFVPNQSGTIIPPNKMGATVIQNINISTGVAATVRNEVLSLLPAIAEVSKGAMMDSQLRGQS